MFIVAGVAQALVGGVFNWNPPFLHQPIGLNITNIGDNLPVGIIFKWEWLLNYYGASALFTTWNGIVTLLTRGELFALVATVLIFLLVVYVESTRIEIPLAHAAVRGRKRQVPRKIDLRISPADDPGQGITGERAIDR